MSNYETVLAQAQELPVDDKIQLIEALWDLVPEASLPPLSDAWIAEIQQRSAEFDSGGVETISWEKIREAALNRIGLSSE
jgi:putative addiction module component (TIGR02574 family)